jgi:phage protein D/phage baseplate assembly protein gpV
VPANLKLTDHILIKVDETDLSTEIMDDLFEVTVDSNLNLPDMFTISLHDEKLNWVSEGPFKLGTPVEISAIPEEGGKSKLLFKGEITALEPDFREGTQAMLLARGYARSHRLHRGTHTQVYLQVTDSDLAMRIANEAGLRAQVDPTNEVYDYVLQNNLSHSEFLAERAQRIGYEFFVNDKSLCFRKPPENAETIELEWGKNLRNFRPHLTLVEQVDEVIIKGWDPKNQRSITGQAKRGRAEPKTGQQQSGGQQAASAFNSARRVVVDRVVHSQAEADTMAQALLDEISGAFLEAEGLCVGQPDLCAGKSVKISSLGKKFNGTYFVTSATHIYRADRAYETSFCIHGRRSDSLSELLKSTSHSTSAWTAPVIGIVTNNKDPEDWGRVKVKFPSLGDEIESNWARLVTPGGGAETGFYSLPEVNDEVLVVFEHGDVNSPFVIGGLWNGRDKPPIPSSKVLKDGKVHQRAFRTRAGHKLIFTDGSEASLVIETAEGHRLTLADEKKQVVVETKNGQVLTLDDSKNAVSLESKGNLTITSGANLTIEANGALSIKGQTFEINANATGKVEASATLEVKGGMVMIN